MTDKYISSVQGNVQWGDSKHRNKTSLEIEFEGDYTLDEFVSELAIVTPDGLFFESDEEDELDPLPDAERVILNAPATVVLWKDGTKTVSKARGGDEYDPLFGLIACIIRKLTHNKGHAVDEFEGLIKELSECIHSTEDIDGLTDFCLLTLDVLTTLRCTEGKWLPQLGNTEQDYEAAEESKRTEELKNIAEDIAKTQEEIRQMVRNLTLDGEL